jgi:DNA-binding beta-propeller fold protein YncE
MLSLYGGFMEQSKTLFCAIFFVFAISLSLYAQAPISDNMPAVGVLGQTNFVSSAGGTTSSTLNNPFGVAIDPTTGKLFVADRNNSRVLRYSSAAKLVDGSPAEAVLGQPDFRTGTVNTGGISASTMNLPVRISIDTAGRLWVSDYDNHRVLRFDNASAKATGDPADGVLGQPNFTTNTSGVTAGKMSRPSGIFADRSGRLWVS